MKLGMSLPQGCDREYIGLSPAEAWQRTVDIARLCEAAGFESLWINDHFQVDPPVIEAPILEPFVELAGLALVTSRARLGHLVRLYGNIAVDSRTYVVAFAEGGAKTDLPARYTFVLVKNGGQWQIVDHHSSTMPK